MIAIDANVILRFLTRQPKAQLEAARALFQKGDLFVCTPVVMEAYLTLELYAARLIDRRVPRSPKRSEIRVGESRFQDFRVRHRSVNFRNGLSRIVRTGVLRNLVLQVSSFRSVWLA